MVDRGGAMPNAVGDGIIPVFTVLKNNTFVKNIFLIDSPPSLPTTNGLNDETLEPHQDSQTLLVGRHPDCHIRLEHPSVSRVHLQIHSKPSEKKLSVTDLSSVHGTWISGERIAPKIRVDLNEGDSLRIGGSSRIYRLYWIPLSQAYDLSNPFVPPPNLQPIEEHDEECIDNDETLQVENAPLSGVEGVETVNKLLASNLNFNLSEGDNLLLAPSVPGEVNPYDTEFKNKDMQYVNFAWEGSEVLLLDRNHVVDEIVAEEVEHNPADEEKLAEYVELISALEVLPEKGQQNSEVEEILAEVEQTENGSSCLMIVNEDMQSGDSNLEVSAGGKENNAEAEGDVDEIGHSVQEESTFISSESSPLGEQVVTTFSLTEELQNVSTSPEAMVLPFPNLEFDIENQLPSSEVFEMHPTSEKWRPSNNDTEEGNAWSFWYPSPIPSSVKRTVEDTNILTIGKNSQCPEVECVQEENNFGTNAENSLWSFWSGNLGVESMCSSSLSDAESQLTRYENLSPLMRSAERTNSSSRRGQSTMSAPQVRTIYTTKKAVAETDLTGMALFNRVEDQNSSPDKENHTPNTQSSLRNLSRGRLLDSDSEKSMTNALYTLKQNSGAESCVESRTVDDEPIARALFNGVDQMEEVFSPDRENYAPNKIQTSSLRKLSNLRDAKKDYDFEKSPNARPQQKSARLKGTSGRPVKLAIVTKGEDERRMPFQTLFTSSPEKTITETSVSSACGRTRSRMSKNKHSEEKRVRRWTMIVDVSSLLNKESRKALQLLEGIKGTQLIIPRTVMRELGFIKRQTSFFRKTNTQASLALEWLDECMFKPNHWVHIQSSVEDGSKSTAPTPPLSPNSSPFCESSFSPAGLVQAAIGAFSEIDSPTVEDSVLDYALSFKRLNSGENVVLLTDLVPLKIKAMAEGLICETADEFQGSLVNPFSERFLWADSSPRGQTWSYLDDVVLREHFYPDHSIMLTTPKKAQNAKGLKLILLHNSQYKRISSVR